MSRVGAAVVLAVLGTSQLPAQITTGSITGTVTDNTGRPLESAQIQVTNTGTGFRTGVLTRETGRYVVPGLEVGAYSVTVRIIGYAPETRPNVVVTLGQATRLDVQLTAQAAQLSAVTVQAVATSADFSPTRQGVGTLVSDTVIRRVPTLNRDFTDLVKLTPQVTRGNDGPNAAGTYNRYNNFQIDGANQNDRFNLGSSGGQPGGATGGRLISQEAIREVQVLISPTDVRYGNFGGLLLNAVTRNGTNTWTGGATYTFRNSDLAADTTFIRNSDLEVQQFGFTLGGPVVRDRLHFFVAPEFQRRSQPAAGPYIGTAAGLDLAPASITDIESTIRSFGIDPGTTGQVRNDNPLTNLFGRVDFQINQTHRAAFSQIVNRAEQEELSRNNNTFNNNPLQQNSGFRFGSNGFLRENRNTASTLQFFSTFRTGAQNDFKVAYNTISDERILSVRTPEVSVAVRPASGGTPQAVTFGTEQFSPDNLLEQKLLEVTENFILPVGNHTMTFGGRFEHADIYNNFAQRLFGVYLFLSPDSLRRRQPTGYTVGYSNGGPIAADFAVNQYSVYAQDQWALTPRFTLSYGVRADIPQFLDTPALNDTILRRANIRTDAVPETQVLFSPRVGFNWDLTGNQQNQIRGNIGIYTNPPPFILVANAYQNTGLGLVTLSCTGAQTPDFVTDVSALPRSCRGQNAPLPGQAGTAGVNVNDPDLKYPQNWTASLGIDRQLPFGFVGTFEALYRRAINGLWVVDRNLREGGVVDRTGRLLYTDSIATNGSVPANRVRRLIPTVGTPAVTFSEGIIEVQNQSRDYSYTLTAQLRRRFGQSLELTGAYNFLQAKDLQSLTSDRAISNWRNGRQIAGSQLEQNLTSSAFERPHRVLLSGTYTAPWKRAATDVSFFYEGISGLPYTLVSNGDLNGDGTNFNDPLYIPRNATDVNEIRFSDIAPSNANPAGFPAALQAQEFERFIGSQDCLNEQRGRIMERHSCRSPFQHRLDASIRQSLPSLVGQRVTLQLDVFNFLNLLNRDWGVLDVPAQSPTFPSQAALVQTSRTAGPLNTSQPVFSINSQIADPANPRQIQFFRPRPNNVGDFYQLQLTARYAF